MLYSKEAEQKIYIASNPLVVMLFGGGASLEACFCSYFRAILFSIFSTGKEFFALSTHSLPNEGADLRTDVSPDSERMEPAKPIRLEGDTPGAWSKFKTGQGWVLTNLAPVKAIAFNTLPFRAVTHPNLPSPGKERSTLNARFLSNDGSSEWETIPCQLQAYPLAPCGRGQNFKLSSAKLRNSGEGSTPVQRRSTC